MRSNNPGDGTQDPPATNRLPQCVRIRRLTQLPTAIVSVFVVFAFMAALPGPASAQFIRDTEIERLLSDYSRPIFRVAGLGGGRIQMRIIRSSQFNAFVVDGGNVFLNTGVLMQAETPNEVIGVIAHETGHIAGGHLAGLRAKIRQDQTRLLLMKVLGIGAVIAGAASGDDTASNVAGGIGQGLLTGGDSAAVRSILSYRRVQESAADQAAVGYLNRTRQSSRGMLTTFERFAQQEMFSTRLQDPYVRSHPMARQRITQLRDLAARSPYYNNNDTPELQLRHDMMRAKLSGYLEQGAALRRYPASDQSLPAQYARAIGTFFTSGAARAMPLVDNLIATRPDNPYFYELKGDFLLRSGHPRDAIPHLQRAYRMTDQANLIGIMLAKAMIATDDRSMAAEAATILRKAVATEQFADGYAQLARAYGILGRQADGLLAAAQASFLRGDLTHAKRMAGRAQAGFPRNSPEWLRADDILKYQQR